MITTDWKNEVLRQMTACKDGQIIELKKSHPNYEKFVEAVKVIIDWKLDFDNSFELTFNDDYTKLSKHNWVLKTKKTK